MRWNPKSFFIVHSPNPEPSKHLRPKTATQKLGKSRIKKYSRPQRHNNTELPLTHPHDPFLQNSLTHSSITKSFSLLFFVFNLSSFEFSSMGYFKEIELQGNEVRIKTNTHWFVTILSFNSTWNKNSIILLAVKNTINAEKRLWKKVIELKWRRLLVHNHVKKPTHIVLVAI